VPPPRATPEGSAWAACSAPGCVFAGSSMQALPASSAALATLDQTAMRALGVPPSPAMALGTAAIRSLVPACAPARQAGAGQSALPSAPEGGKPLARAMGSALHPG
jgi:hypothetical protein